MTSVLRWCSRGSSGRSGIPATSPSGCPRAATPRTWCAPSMRPAGAGCSPSAWPATRAGRWPSLTPSTTSSWPRRPRSTGYRKPRPRSTRCSGNSPLRRCPMCLGIPGEVVEIDAERPDLAKVTVSGVRRLINIGLLADDPPKPGECVLIHVGFALSKIDEDEAAAAMEFLESIGQAYEDELAALQDSMID